MGYASPTATRITRAGAACFLLLVLAPMFASALDGDSLIETLRLSLPTGRKGALLLNSLSLAALTAALTTLLGALTGIAMLTPGRLPTRLKLLFPALFLVPPHIHSLAWSRLFHWTASLFGLPLANGLPAAAWVQTMHLLPLGAGLAALALAHLDRAGIETGLTMAEPGAVWRSIVLPQATPMLLAGVGLAFVLSLVDYGIPSLFQVNTYAMEIFAEFSASGQAARPLALSLALLVPSGAVLAATHRGLRKVLLAPSRKTEGAFLPPWPVAWRPLRLLGSAIALVQAAVPLTVLVLGLSKGTTGGSTVLGSLGELVYSLAVSAAAALLALLPALGYARVMQRGGSLRWLLPLVALAIPAPLTGAGLIALFRGTPLMGSDLLPALASACRFMPAAALILAAALSHLPEDRLEAGLVFAGNESRFARKIFLPLLAPGLAAALLLVFALALGELGATLMVCPPGRGTVTMKIYNYLHAGTFDAVAGLCLATLGLVLGGMLFAQRMAFGDKIGRRPSC
ncbi:ABC transporter permease subunit [Pseudodesulfovibrio cashew]|nr:ABC transporter permease subunit [Pseudodesulfovibrio cashew]